MIVAHGIGGVRDLPVPTWLFSWGAAVVLVLSFLLIGTLWKRSQLERRAEGRPLPPWLERLLRSTALRVLPGAFSAALLVLVLLTALLGEPSSATNLAPTFVYVVFWLGIVPLQVVLGNVWPALNPWLAIAGAGRLDLAFARQLRDLDRDGSCRPKALGRAGRGVHRLLRPPGTDRAVRRA